MPATKTVATPERDQLVEDHLRAVIESQPVCLTRIAADGTFLAVNEAALSMFGAERLEQVLDTSVLELVIPEHRSECLAFLQRAAGGTRGSHEVDLEGRHGLRHTLQLHAVTLPSYPDGIASALCTFRDVTEHRRLERALLEASARQDELAAELAVEHAQLSAALEDTRTRQVEEHAAGQQARILAIEEELREAHLRIETVTRDHADERTQLEAELRTAQDQIETLLADHLQRISQAEEALAAARAREEALARDRDADRAAWDRERAEGVAAAARLDEITAGAAALQQELNESTAREGQLLAQLEAAEATWREHADAAALEHARAMAALESRVAELEAAAAAADDERASLRASAEQATAREREALTAAERAADRERDAAAATARARAEQQALADRLADEVLSREAAEEAAASSRDAALVNRTAVGIVADLAVTLDRLAAEGREAARHLDAGSPARTVLDSMQRTALRASHLAYATVGRTETALAAVVNLAAVVRESEALCAAMLGPDIALTVLAGEADVPVRARRDDLEGLLVALVANRRAALGSGGQLTIELADVDIDDACARERGGVTPGHYVLLALHATGAGVAAASPSVLLNGPAPADVWRDAGPCMGPVCRVVASAGGHLWATREGEHSVAFEIYLPRAGAVSAR